MRVNLRTGCISDWDGGFETIADYLADDYELGRRIAAQNLSVALSRSVVDSFLPAYDFSQFLSHQLRWARTIRASRPGGYAGLLLTFTLPWALLSLVLARGADWALALFALAFLIRILMAVTVGKLVLSDRELLRSLWLLPIRDLLAVVLWMGGLAGRKIVWRGQTFHRRFRLDGICPVLRNYFSRVCEAVHLSSPIEIATREAC